DLSIYVERLQAQITGRELLKVRLRSIFLLRSVDPPLVMVEGTRVTGVRRMGKRIVIALQGELFLLFHLMVAGRLRWHRQGATIPKSNGLAAFDFENGTLLVTEASKKKRASLHVVKGEDALASFEYGGVEVFDVGPEEFRDALSKENHTLKRALTDPRIISGIGNSYSDEILFVAKLSPFKQTRILSDDEFTRLYRATVETLTYWIEKLRMDVGDSFPEKVGAFREGMAVHGRYREPCPVCGAPIQRIVYAENECNYCARCQTGGRLLADRARSRLLKANWPKTLDELEGHRPS
ncbi:MAG: DNA-formamidopyrimidine glycosylase family protein, partial [Acidiferrobacterales bacterium]